MKTLSIFLKFMNKISAVWRNRASNRYACKRCRHYTDIGADFDKNCRFCSALLIKYKVLKPSHFEAKEDADDYTCDSGSCKGSKDR